MTATVAQLAARTLQRIGVSISAPTDRPVVAETRTLAAIGNRALERLGVYPPDETPAAADAASALETATGLHAHLVSIDVASWAAAAIPVAAAEPYTMMTAALLAPSFGKPLDLTTYEACLTALRRMVISGPRGQAMAEQAVRDVHQSLTSRGLTRWLMADLPAYAEEPYVLMASFLLAPRAGVQADPTAWEGGERLLRRAIMVPSAGGTVRQEYF